MGCRQPTIEPGPGAQQNRHNHLGNRLPARLRMAARTGARPQGSSSARRRDRCRARPLRARPELHASPEIELHTWRRGRRARVGGASGELSGGTPPTGGVPPAEDRHKLRTRRRIMRDELALINVIGELSFDSPIALEELAKLECSYRWCFASCRV